MFRHTNPKKKRSEGPHTRQLSCFDGADLLYKMSSDGYWGEDWSSAPPTHIAQHSTRICSMECVPFASPACGPLHLHGTSNDAILHAVRFVGGLCRRGLFDGDLTNITKTGTIRDSATLHGERGVWEVWRRVCVWWKRQKKKTKLTISLTGISFLQLRFLKEMWGHGGKLMCVCVCVCVCVCLCVCVCCVCVVCVCVCVCCVCVCVCVVCVCCVCVCVCVVLCVCVCVCVVCVCVCVCVVCVCVCVCCVCVCVCGVGLLCNPLVV